MISSGPRCHLGEKMCERNSAAGRRRSTLMLPKRGSVVLLQEYVHCEAFLGGGGGS